MQMDRTYKIGKSLILDGTIKTFADIFEYVPKSRVAKDLKMHYNTLLSRLATPGSFSLNELTAIAELLDIDPMSIISMAFNDYNQGRKGKKKK
jgi:hypothetical protein